MQGVGKLVNATDSIRKPPQNCFFWNGKSFEKLRPGSTRLSAQKGEFGPELAFAHTLARLCPKKKIYIVKYYASGQPLHHGWNGNKWLGGNPTPNRANFYPGKTTKDPAQGHLYRNMMTKYKQAIEYLKTQKKNYRIKGLLWMQGEQDAKNKISAQTYAQSLNHLQKRWQADIGTYEVPFIFGQVLPHIPAMKRFTHRIELRQNMSNIHWSSGHKDATANIWMVRTEGMPLKKDTVHYNAAGLQLLGSHFDITMRQAQNHL